MLGDVLACVVALISGTGAGRALADSSPSPRDSGVAQRRIVASGDFHVVPVSCAQTHVCGAEVASLLLLRDFKDT